VSRIDEALRRMKGSGDGVPVAAGGQALFNPAWPISDREHRTAAIDAGPTAAVDHDRGLGRGTKEAGIAGFSSAWRERLASPPDGDPGLIEQFRRLAATLHQAQRTNNLRSVMVTSALPSEGKTLTATNLALTVSESYQRRVLLIDADLRRPRIKDMFGLADGEGLSDSLNNPRGGRLPVHQITPTLWVLTAGRATADPMSTLVSAAMKHLLEDAREAFDWVVVDTPPIAILPDANLLASMIDTALLVVSAQQTPYPMVQRAAEAIGRSRILGVVLNRADAAGLTSGYGLYSYGGTAPPETPSRWSRWFRKNRGVPHVQ